MVRVNRRTYHVQVESKTVRDDRISFRALGLLTYCLDQADSWNVRSEQLARGEGREGRDAVRKALHELAAHGYYRLEKRRFLDGKTGMGAAVSEYPVEQWARDYVTFDKKLDIPVVEQGDGSFCVRFKDGTLGSDGFDEPAYAPAPQEDAPGQEAPAPAETDTVQPPKVPKKRRTPPAAARAKAKKAEQNAKAADEPNSAGAGDKSKQKTPAQEVAAWYYEHAIQRLGPYAGKQKSGWFFGLVNLSQQALDADYTQKQVARAFQRAGVHFPTAHQFQRALSDERNNKPMPDRFGGRPAPYSDAATWGTALTDSPPTPTHSDIHDDEAVFGVVPA